MPKWPQKKGRYDGPVCWIPFDHAGPDGKALKGGWHYSTKQHRRYGEIPDKPLHLNDSDPLGVAFYEYAQAHHESWEQKHGKGNIITLQALNGDHPLEAHDSHPDHEAYKKSLEQ